MKRLIFPLVLIAGTALSGCTVMAPYEQPYSSYYAATPYYYGQPYAPGYGYAVPAPLYDYPVYVGPPLQFSFSLDYRSGGRHGFRHGFHHRHGFGVHGGFRGHGFPGRHGWRR